VTPLSSPMDRSSNFYGYRIVVTVVAAQYKYLDISPPPNRSGPLVGAHPLLFFRFPPIANDQAKRDDSKCAHHENMCGVNSCDSSHASCLQKSLIVDQNRLPWSTVETLALLDLVTVESLSWSWSRETDRINEATCSGLRSRLRRIAEPNPLFVGRRYHRLLQETGEGGKPPCTKQEHSHLRGADWNTLPFLSQFIVDIVVKLNSFEG
jgi:hypothetical protein